MAIDVSTQSDDELIKMWQHYEWVLSQCVSMSDIWAQYAIEQELIKRGYDRVESGEIVKV